MRIHEVSADAALGILRSGPRGLSADEARRRLAEFGPNDIERVERPSPVLALLREATHFFAVLLWVAAGLAFAAALAEPGSGMATLGAAIVGVIAVNAVFSFWQQHRAEQALQALESSSRHACWRCATASRASSRPGRSCRVTSCCSTPALACRPTAG